MNYFDTSALIKYFVEESGSSLVQKYVGQDNTLATSRIAYVEMYSGFTRKRREGYLAQNQYSKISKKFEFDWRAYLQVDLHHDIFISSREILQKYFLRSFDAIHLASALKLHKTLSEGIVFVAADGRLLEAAHAEKLQIVDVSQ